MTNLQYYPLSTPLSAQVELTSDCTSHCIHCYNYWHYLESERAGRELEKSEFMEVVDRLGMGNVFEIVFTGGEPLLRRDVLFDLAEKSKDYNMETRLNSNLVLLSKEDVKMIKSSNIVNILTSLLSYRMDIHNNITMSDSFDKILTSISLLRDNGIDTAVNMVVMQQNKNDVYDTCRFLYEHYDINGFCATPVGQSAPEHVQIQLTQKDIVNTLDALLSAQRDFNIRVDTVEPIPLCLVDDVEKYRHFLRRDCSAGKTTVTVAANGDVRPCTHVSKMYGNLLEESLDEIWLKMNDWRTGAYTPQKCACCTVLELCSMGCREAASVILGDYNEEDPYTIGFGPIMNKVGFKKTTSPIGLDDVFCIPNDIRYRKEGDNYILFSTNKHIAVMLNGESFRSFSNLYGHDFSLRSLGNQPGVEDVLSYLSQRGIINLLTKQEVKNGR